MSGGTFCVGMGVGGGGGGGAHDTYRFLPPPYYNYKSEYIHTFKYYNNNNKTSGLIIFLIKSLSYHY